MNKDRGVLRNQWIINMKWAPISDAADTEGGGYPGHAFNTPVDDDYYYHY